MNMKDLLIMLGAKPDEAANLAQTEEAFNEDELHLLRLLLEVEQLGVRAERRRWEEKMKNK